MPQFFVYVNDICFLTGGGERCGVRRARPDDSRRGRVRAGHLHHWHRCGVSGRECWSQGKVEAYVAFCLWEASFSSHLYTAHV